MLIKDFFPFSFILQIKFLSFKELQPFAFCADCAIIIISFSETKVGHVSEYFKTEFGYLQRIMWKLLKNKIHAFDDGGEILILA